MSAHETTKGLQVSRQYHEEVIKGLQVSRQSLLDCCPSSAERSRVLKAFNGVILLAEEKLHGVMQRIDEAEARLAAAAVD
jgi:hypothetical protein